MKSRPIMLRAIGDWQGDVKVGLDTLIAVVIEKTGKTAAQACANVLVMMAQTLRKLTPTAKKNRPVLRDMTLHGSEYVNVYRQNGKGASDDPIRLFRFRFSENAAARDALDGTWEQAKRIKAAGLAKRSIFWPLRGLPGAGVSNSKPVRGVSSLFVIKSGNTAGYELTDRLSFLLKILPAGWRETCEQAAVSRVLAPAAHKIDRDFLRELGKTRAAQTSALRRASSEIDAGRFLLPAGAS